MAKKQAINENHVVYVSKDGDKLVARDDVQAAAFEKMGFKKENSDEE